MFVPLIETERLILRGAQMSDFPAYAEMWADPEFARYITGKPQTEEESWSRFLRNAGQWALLDKGFWLLEEKETSEMIGQCGFVEALRQMDPSLRGKPELGWALKPSVWGHGYATEAAEAALTWGNKTFGKVRNYCIIEPENAPSIRVAARLKFEPERDVPYLGKTVRLFHRDPPGL
jgi:RimJ/RimL family protein N-acetyltransferase